MFDNNKVSVSSNGVMYRLDRKGLIPVLLENGLMKELNKALMKKHGDVGEDDKYGYSNAGTAFKIILNSLYGVLGLPVFRFMILITLRLLRSPDKT